jgi:hypothetical protein
MSAERSSSAAERQSRGGPLTGFGVRRAPDRNQCRSLARLRGPETGSNALSPGAARSLASDRGLRRRRQLDESTSIGRASPLNRHRPSGSFSIAPRPAEAAFAKAAARRFAH